MENFKGKISFNIRKFRKSDVDSLVKHANNYNVAKFLTSEFPYPYFKEDAESFIAYISNENPTKVFAIEIEGEAAGAIAITPQEEFERKSGELGYWIAEKYWNNGIASSAIEKIVDYGFKTFDIDRIYATPFIENKASQRVLIKSGFKQESESKVTIIKNNEPYDVFIFSKTK
ncbi:MAG: GNAT family N-acetyltransferase [Methanobacteriaceae archaeon]|jgi:RimJ/RimL family protein N-acetyltransferase|nr:GNAT family N-acetyltransferase [Candidatus Methanorudis spinitermitis]